MRDEGLTRLVGISGSLRKGSLNSALLRAAQALMPAGSQLDIVTIRGIPLYDGDEEAAHGEPTQVAVLKQAIASADGLLLVTPEYNNSIPGVFKNAIDWVSRAGPDGARVFAGRHVAVIGASPGNFGTILAQEAWLPVLRTLGTHPWFEGRLMVPHASGVFDADGNLADDSLKSRLASFLAGFVKAIAGNVDQR